MYQPPAFCAAAGIAKAAAAKPRAVTTEAILMVVTPSLSFVGTVVRTLTKPPLAGTAGRGLPAPQDPLLLPNYNELAGDGGGSRNRTGVHGFAGRCMNTLPSRRAGKKGKVPSQLGWAIPSDLERETSLELATSTLARLRSTN